MKNKKGFTLVELLAVVLILGLLFSIAVPSVHRFLLKGSETYYENLEKTVLLAGRDYFDDYRSVLPKEIGNVTVLESKDIVGNHYIDKVVDKNNKECEIKVTAKKVEKGKFEYYSCIICEDYQSDIENCQHTEDQNVTKESKDYRVEVSPDFYVVEQGRSINLPYGRAYYLEELVSNKVVPMPNIVNTSTLGVKQVIYWYHGAKKIVTIEVVDRQSPSKTQVVMRENNENGKKYESKNGNNKVWFSGSVYQQFRSTDTTSEELNGSGINYYEIDKGSGTFQKVQNSSGMALNYEKTSENGEYTYKIRSVDKSGNVSDVNEYSFYIDTLPPVCAIDIIAEKGENDWYTSDVQLLFNGTKTYDQPTTSPSGINTKTITTISTTAVGQKADIFSNTVTLTDNSNAISVLGTITDNSKNSSGVPNTNTCNIVDGETEIETIKIDKKIPETPTITASDGKDSGSWHPGNAYGQVTLTVSGAFSTSGISYYIDSDLNKINAVKNRTNITATPAGDLITTATPTVGTTYYAIACNGAGTCSDVASYLLKLDNVKPVAPTIAASDLVGSGSWHKSGYSLSLSGASNISGNVYYYGLDATPTIASNTITSGASVTVNSATINGNTYYAKVCSGAGLCSAKNSAYVAKLDTVTPVAPTITPKYADGTATKIASGKWHKKKFTLHGSGASNVSGNTYYYGTSSNPTSTAKPNITDDTEKTSYYVKVCSGAGLCSGNSTYEAKLDATPPTCTSSGGSTSTKYDDVTITGTCTDATSKCKEAKVTRTFTTDHDADESPGTVYDNAGNSTTCPTQHVKISTSKYIIEKGAIVTANASKISKTKINDYVSGGKNVKSSSELGTVAFASHPAYIQSDYYGLSSMGVLGSTSEKPHPVIDFTLTFDESLKGKKLSMAYYFAYSAQLGTYVEESYVENNGTKLNITPFYIQSSTVTREINGVVQPIAYAIAYENENKKYFKLSSSSTPTLRFKLQLSSGKNDNWAPSIWVGIRYLKIED